jgi:membrane protease YdiL (CAAX protease family)
LPASRNLVVRHPLAAYVGLAYAISWAWWIPLAVDDRSVRPGAGWPTHIPGLMGPLLAAVIVTWIVGGRDGLADLWSRVVHWRAGWWWAAVPAILALGALGLLFTSGDPEVRDLTAYPGIDSDVGALAIVVIAFLGNGLGEEVGWRGFAADRLLRTGSLTRASLLVAAMWAPWHLPMFFLVESFEGFTPFRLNGWLLGLTAGSFLLTWLYRGSGWSILLVAAWHTAYNFTAATEAAGDSIGAITSSAVMVVAVVLWVSDRRRPRSR